jgi:hypothetical protein
MPRGTGIDRIAQFFSTADIHLARITLRYVSEIVEKRRGEEKAVVARPKGRKHKAVEPLNGPEEQTLADA